MPPASRGAHAGSLLRRCVLAQRFRRLAADTRLWRLVTGAATPADAAGGRRLAGRHGRRAYATLHAAVAASRCGPSARVLLAAVVLPGGRLCLPGVAVSRPGRTVCEAAPGQEAGAGRWCVASGGEVYFTRQACAG